MTMTQHPSLFDQEPKARTSDPLVSHLAAASVKPSNARLIMDIRKYVFLYGASTSFEIADALASQLGVQHDTVRSAVSRAGLTQWPGGTAPSGRACSLYGHAGVDVYDAEKRI